jgi:hypothetical protein
MSTNYETFMKMNLTPYTDEWIAICDNKLVSHGKSVKNVLNEAKKVCPGKRPFVAKVPGKETMIL